MLNLYKICFLIFLKFTLKVFFFSSHVVKFSFISLYQETAEEVRQMQQGQEAFVIQYQESSKRQGEFFL